MSIFDELKQDAVQAGAMLGAVLGFVVLFVMWTIGTWLIVVVGLLIAAGYLMWNFRDRF